VADRIHYTEDATALAKKRLPRLIYDFIAGATGRELGKQLNREVLSAIRLQPRVLVNVENRNISTRLLGQSYGLPLGIAPMGMCNLVWPDADRSLKQAADHFNIPHCLSTAASTSIEVMAEMGEQKPWFQLYVSQSQEAAFNLVDRAYKSGYETLVFTVDVPQVSRRIRDLRNGFQMPFRTGPKKLIDFALHPQWSIRSLLAGTPKPMNFQIADGKSSFARNASRGGCDWAFLDELRRTWKGQLIVKGVTSAEDALRIKQAGVDAIYVSNHGGRQLDSAPPAILALSTIREAVGEEFPLIFDSGIRNGEDVVKALVMGADFVMLGRPMLFALGADGKRGVNTLIQLIAEEIDVVMAQLGVTKIDEINRAMLAEHQLGIVSKNIQFDSMANLN
jgi:L-lactate dehydrogenase (cytochrome)